MSEQSFSSGDHTTPAGSTNDADQQQGSQGTQFSGEEQNQTPTLESLGLTFDEIVAMQKRDAHAQDFIPTLKEETASLRTALEEIRDAQQLGVQDVLKGQNQDQKGLSSEELVQQVRQELKNDELNAVREGNFREVLNTLTDTLGSLENADKHINEVCARKGITVEKAVELAKDSPALALDIFGVERKVSPSSMSSTTNTSQFQQAQDPVVHKKMTDMRTTKEQVNYFQDRSAQILKDLGY